jgi:type I restriction enzyme M protein
MGYVKQITFLLFLKMADEQTKPPYNRRAIVPTGYDWASLLSNEDPDTQTKIQTP